MHARRRARVAVQAPCSSYSRGVRPNQTRAVVGQHLALAWRIRRVELRGRNGAGGDPVRRCGGGGERGVYRKERIGRWRERLARSQKRELAEGARRTQTDLQPPG